MSKSHHKRSALSLTGIAASVLLCLGMLGACTTMGPMTIDQAYARHRPMLKVLIQLAVSEFLDRHTAMAPLVGEVAQAVHDELAGRTGTVPTLTTALQLKLAQAAFTPNQRLLLMNFVDALMQTVRGYFAGQQLLPTKVEMPLADLCAWIAEMAHGYAP